MKHNYLLLAFCILLTFGIASCTKDNDDAYIPIEPEPEPEIPVSVDLTKIPYAKLSDYHFFDGDIKEQLPATGVIPYAPASSLFTDYAHKKRFIWLPKDTKATYNSDGTVLELPVGAALIKTFYYDNVQNATPAGSTRIIETRIMIRKSSGWIFANYVWNSDQTEALFSLAGSFTDITWKDENNLVKTAQYRIPSEEQCIVCHKAKDTNGETIHIPIGIKPQNLNTNYNYGSGPQNQLSKWMQLGLVENFSLPTAENSTVDYNDTSKSVDQRVRSYFDINCAHCHQADRHCDYRPMRFAFSETANNRANMGVCVSTQDMQGFPETLNKIVTPASIDNSMLYYRLNTVNPTYRMPLHGRTIIHTEGLSLIREWIDSLERCD